ncbi:MAG: hypothetical protein LBP54_06295 [Campylobacteraceae bacterium]|nr:hypothetical protein [Campylobacteraceae bacterium]
MKIYELLSTMKKREMRNNSYSVIASRLRRSNPENNIKQSKHINKKSDFIILSIILFLLLKVWIASSYFALLAMTNGGSLQMMKGMDCRTDFVSSQ